MPTAQANFLDIIDPDIETIPITVSQLSETQWIAIIAGGWWQARGRTKMAAIKKVIEAIKKIGDSLTPH